MMVSAARLCVTCKGARMLCGLKTCPVLSRFSTKARIDSKLKQDFFGPSTSVFIGRYNYPNVFAGPLAPLAGRDADDINIIDQPSEWFGRDYSSIIEMRSGLLRSKQAENVFSGAGSVGDLQEIAMARRPPDVEMNFSKRPLYRVSFSDVMQPMGPSAMLKKMSLAENVRIPRRLERIVTDEISARQAGIMLYSSGEDVYKISTILSSGVLGLGKRRKLVPTRWSITAGQTMIADALIGDLKDFPSINEYRVYSSRYLDNHFQVLLMPGSWEFENFEAWAPGTPWSMDAKGTQILGEYEPYGGRKRYAELQGGGFYASRLGVAEGLKALRRQARVVVFREVYEGYVVPLGVWQVLENVRNVFKRPFRKFDTREKALEHIGSRLRIGMDKYRRKSVMLRQKRLYDFNSTRVCQG